jgi:hypothetical protein
VRNEKEPSDATCDDGPESAEAQAHHLGSALTGTVVTISRAASYDAYGTPAGTATWLPWPSPRLADGGYASCAVCCSQVMGAV